MLPRPLLFSRTLRPIKRENMVAPARPRWPDERISLAVFVQFHLLSVPVRSVSSLAESFPLPARMEIHARYRAPSSLRPVLVPHIPLSGIDAPKRQETGRKLSYRDE